MALYSCILKSCYNTLYCSSNQFISNSYKVCIRLDRFVFTWILHIKSMYSFWNKSENQSRYLWKSLRPDPNHPLLMYYNMHMSNTLSKKGTERELGVSKSYKQLHATLDRQNPWGMSADLSTSNPKKKSACMPQSYSN